MPRSRGPVGAVVDQRAPVRSFTGENTARRWAPWITACSGEAFAASAAAYVPPRAIQGLHKLGVKRRRLSAERLKLLAVAGKQRRHGRRHLVAAPATIPVVGAAAAALAALRSKPMVAKFEAADVIISGAATA